MATPDFEQWASDEQLLAAIGQALSGQAMRVQVRMPRRLAEAALAAWRRDDSGVDLTTETPAEAATRRNAASVALIGLSIEQQGLPLGEDVVLELDAWNVGAALTAADAAGLL